MGVHGLRLLEAVGGPLRSRRQLQGAPFPASCFEGLGGGRAAAPAAGPELSVPAGCGQIVIVGLSNAGKTTILYRLRLSEVTCVLASRVQLMERLMNR